MTTVPTDTPWGRYLAAERSFEDSSGTKGEKRELGERAYELRPKLLLDGGGPDRPAYVVADVDVSDFDWEAVLYFQNAKDQCITLDQLIAIHAWAVRIGMIAPAPAGKEAT